MLVVKKKQILMQKISDLKNENITIADYNKFTKDIVTNEIKKLNQSDIAGLTDNTDLEKSSNISNKSKIKSRKR